MEEQAAGSGRNGDAVVHILAMDDLGELHLGPELDQVNGQESEHHDAQDEHVLRRPLYLRLAAVDLIAVGAAGLAVLDGEPERVADVDDEESCETH